MENIPQINEIIDKIGEIDEKLEEERNKPDDEYDKQREFELIYAKMIAGLKLNTGFKMF
jgi:hypothetical protein